MKALYPHLGRQWCVIRPTQEKRTKETGKFLSRSMLEIALTCVHLMTAHYLSSLVDRRRLWGDAVSSGSNRECCSISLRLEGKKGNHLWDHEARRFHYVSPFIAVGPEFFILDLGKSSPLGLSQLRRYNLGNSSPSLTERVKGFEPSTSCLGSKHSAAELHPHLATKCSQTSFSTSLSYPGQQEQALRRYAASLSFEEALGLYRKVNSF